MYSIPIRGSMCEKVSNYKQAGNQLREVQLV